MDKNFEIGSLKSPMYPHPIRLGEPWQRTETDAGASYRRRFNCPTGLASREQVWLVVERPAGAATIACNGHALGKIPRGQDHAEFLLTDCLQSHNELVLDVSGSADHASETGRGVVRLEIRLGPASI